MIARLLLPLQRRARRCGPRIAPLALLPFALSAWFHPADILLSVAAFVAAPGLMAWRQCRSEGELGAATATGVLWAAMPFAWVGALGTPAFAALHLVSALVGTFVAIPLACATPQTSPTALRPLPPTHLGPVVAALTALGGLAALALAAGTSSAPAFATPSGVENMHLLGWALCWSLLAQRVLGSVLVLGGLLLVALTPTPLSPLALGVFVSGVAAAAADNLSQRTPSLPHWLGTLGVWALAGGGFALMGAPSLAAAAGLGGLIVGAGGVVSGHLRATVLAERRPRPQRSQAAASAAMRQVRYAAHRLPPFFRWFAIAKLASDPLYARVAQASASPRKFGAILDVGAGTGLASALLIQAPTAQRITLLDTDAEKLRAATGLVKGGSAGKSVQVLQGLFSAAAPPEGQFDTVLMFDVLHYADAATQRAMLATARHLLAPEGRIYLRDVVAQDEAGRVARMEGWTTRFGFNPTVTPHFLDEPQWRAFLEEASLERVEQEPCGDENVWMVLVAADCRGEGSDAL